MDKKMRERDLLWCKALVSTLAPYEIQKVTEEFNRIRPDKAAQHGAQWTAGLVAQVKSFFKSLWSAVLRRH